MSSSHPRLRRFSTAVAQSIARGGWAQRRDGTIAVRMLEDVGAHRRELVDQAAHALEVLLGDVRFTVRFPAPMQAGLLA